MTMTLTGSNHDVADQRLYDENVVCAAFHEHVQESANPLRGGERCAYDPTSYQTGRLTNLCGLRQMRRELRRHPAHALKNVCVSRDTSWC